MAMSADPLSPAHRRMLQEQRVISPEVIEARGYRTVTSKNDLYELGFTKAQQRAPGLLIPLHAPDGTSAGNQYRPDVPRTTQDGKVAKYETPKGTGIRIDCPPLCRPQIGDPTVELWITEGIPKGDSLASQGVCSLALMGVWGFKGKNPFGGVSILADLDYVAWKERKVYIVFGSDVMSKPNVQGALRRLTEHLRRKSAQVSHVYLPTGPNGEKVGVDDFLAAGHTVEELRQLAADPTSQVVKPADLVLHQLPDAPVTEKSVVPPGYRLKPEGLFRLEMDEDKDSRTSTEEEKLVAHAPILISSRSRDLDTGEYDLELAWRVQGVWHRTVVRRDVVADHRKLPGAAVNGLPITSAERQGNDGLPHQLRTIESGIHAH